jgi:hypothetical protein
VRADLAPGFLLKMPPIPPGDSHTQDALVGRAGEVMSVLGGFRGVGQGAIRGDPVDAAEVALTLLRAQVSAGVGAADAAIRAVHDVIGPVGTNLVRQVVDNASTPGYDRPQTNGGVSELASLKLYACRGFPAGGAVCRMRPRP